jgi:2-polyprenyl-3-methyl-5-hydroxy-6-metoxy-1,4-benzoquinol methylase
VTSQHSNQACPVCGGSVTTSFANARDVEYYTSDTIYLYLECAQCRSVFLDNPPVDQLDKIYPSNYYSYAPSPQLTSLTERVKSFLDARLFRILLKQLPGDRLRMLDVGGGSGWLLSTLKKVSPRVAETHEIDINERARAEAEAAGHTFHCGRVEDFQSEEKFDLILLLNLIEHVANPAAILRRMQGLLSPDGLILIKTPNVDTLDCRIFRHHNWGGFHCPRHFVLFKRESLLALGTRCGLQTGEASYTQGAPQWACSILGIMGLKGWLNISAERPLYSHPLYAVTCAIAAAFDLARLPFMPTAQMFVVFRRAKDKMLDSN